MLQRIYEMPINRSDFKEFGIFFILYCILWNLLGELGSFIVIIILIIVIVILRHAVRESLPAAIRKYSNEMAIRSHYVFRLYFQL